MKEKVHLGKAIQLISYHFDLRKTAFNENYEEVRKWLASCLAEMVHLNFEQLLNTLYRLDIAERKVRAVFNNQSKEPMYYALADLIIEREIQKIESRERYRSRQRSASASNCTVEDLELLW